MLCLRLLPSNNMLHIQRCPFSFLYARKVHSAVAADCAEVSCLDGPALHWVHEENPAAWLTEGDVMLLAKGLSECSDNKQE